MLINGYSLTQFQRCKRPYIIGKTHVVNKWRPQSLLSMCLRYAIFGLSNGGKLEQVSSIAVNSFLTAARNPGLDVEGIDTYTLAMDYVAIIRNTLEYLSRLTLLTLKEIPPFKLSADISWQFLSTVDEAGVLHRWKFVDYIEDDVLPELHSWEVFGDIAALDGPMQLHLIAIGKRKGCHQHSPWCRIYSHPKLANIYRFQKKSGNQLEGEWRPIWFSANSDNKPKEWVDLMLKDNVIGGIIKHINVKEVSQQHRANFIGDVLAEAEVMSYMPADARAVPMSRYACDKPYTCPHQLFCYSNLALDKVGIYKKVENKHVQVATN